MHGELVFSRDDFALAFSEFLPVTIWLNDDKSHWIHIGPATEVQVRADVGVRVTCSAEVQWTIAGVPTKARADEIRLHVLPTLEPSGDGCRLAFPFKIEEASLRGFLGLFDHAIVQAVDKALKGKTLAWNYSETLDRTFHLPATLFKELTGVRLKTGRSVSRAIDDAVILDLDLEIGFRRA